MKQVTIKIGSQLKIKNLPHHIIPELRSHLIMENPLHAENEKHGHPNKNIPKKLRFISEDSTTMPRGFLNPLRALLKEKKIDYRVIHYTVSRPCLPTLKSKITLKDYQEKAVKKIIKKRFGVLQAPTGSGKTVIAIETIVKRNVITLIVVHTKELMYQWKERLLEFTNLNEEQIGLLGDGHKVNYKNQIVIGIINSLQKQPLSTFQYISFVIIDECHRVPSMVFSKFLVKLNTKYMLGLSATPYRRDKLDKVINFFVGDVVHVIKTKKLQKEGHIMKADLKIIKTSFSPYVHSVYQYAKIIKALTEDKDRNNLILEEIRKETMRGLKGDGITLVLSDRKEHCHSLFRQIDLQLKPVILTGSSSKQMRLQALEELNNGQAKILVATGQLIGEGFDLKHISSVFLTTPIKWEGRLIQYIGRSLRIAEGKEKVTIYDFDDPCWLLKGSFGKRMKTYREMGIEI